MKTKKICLSLAQSVLSKYQMKKIMASSGDGDGDCAKLGSTCSSIVQPIISCCSGLVCDGYSNCVIPT